MDNVAGALLTNAALAGVEVDAPTAASALSAVAPVRNFRLSILPCVLMVLSLGVDTMGGNIATCALTRTNTEPIRCRHVFVFAPVCLLPRH